jgi:DNA-binding MarR family transcriptional regulator
MVAVLAASSTTCRPGAKYVVIDNNVGQARIAVQEASEQAVWNKPRGKTDTVRAARRRKVAGSRQAAAPRRRPGAAASALHLGQLDDRVGYFLRRLQIAIFKDFIRTLAPVDVRPAQYSVLVLITANPGRSQAAIGKTLSIERARLARMLHDLECRKWIERRLSSADGRSHCLFMTAAGNEAMARIESLASQHERQMVKFIGRDLRQLLLDRLRKFGKP